MKEMVSKVKVSKVKVSKVNVNGLIYCLIDCALS